MWWVLAVRLGLVVPSTHYWHVTACSSARLYHQCCSPSCCAPWTFWGPGVHATVTLQRHCYLCRSANHILCMHVWNGSSQNLSELKPDRPSVHIGPNFISCSKHDSLKLILQKPNLYYMIVNLIWGFVTQTSELFEARSKLADIRYWSNISHQLHIGLYGDA